MQATARIEAIAQQCLQTTYSYPEPLVTAICQYVSGNGTLAPVHQEWQRAMNSSPGPSNGVRYFPDRFVVVSDPDAEHLDEIDLRVLDICKATNTLNYFFTKIAAAGPVQEACNYLLAQGMTTQEIISILGNCHHFENGSGTLNALGRLLISYIQDQFAEILQYLATTNNTSFRKYAFRILCKEQPTGYIDLAWQLVQPTSIPEADEFAAELLKVDPARFTDWARQVAHDTILHNQLYQYSTLETLMKLDPARHIDLAIEAAHAPQGARWYRSKLQQTGIEAAYHYDPVQYLPLVEEAAVAPNADLGKLAIRLLKGADFKQARPILQRCVASGDIDAALLALDVLLKYDWPERQSYMLSLLVHRSKQIRDELLKGFMKESLFNDKEQLVKALVPYLSHPNADARLTTIQALRLIVPQQAPALLAPRLDVEKSLKVKQAILDVVGVTTLADAAQSSSASPRDALITEAEAALKRITRPPLPWFSLDQMLALHWKDGESVPPVVLSYLLYLQSRVKTVELDHHIKQALTLLDRNNQGDLAQTLFNGWIGHGAKSEQSWCLPLICALADERLIYPLRQYIDGWVKSSRGALAAKAVGAMALIESDIALAEINNMVERVKHSQVKAAAQKALNDAAEHRQITLEELSDLIVPTLGFDEKGERIFDYGSRLFTARLRFDQTLQLSDSAGKRVTSLPKPGARDEESKAKAAQAAWSLLKKQTPQVIKLQTQRLENALIHQRAWSVARWQALFLHHPVLRSFAITLVWGIVPPGQSGYQTLFRPLEDASLTDPEDNAVILPAEGCIRMVHPVELDETTLNAWQQHLADYEVTPLFPQLNRPVVHVNPDERSLTCWEKYQGYVMNGGALKGRYLKAAWERGAVEDGGAYYSIWKYFPTAGIQAVLETAGMSIGYEQEFTTAIKRLIFERTDAPLHGGYVSNERTITLGKVPSIIFSEVAVDVQTFAAAGEYAEDWERKVW
jgi:hypothetical protein